MAIIKVKNEKSPDATERVIAMIGDAIRNARDYSVTKSQDVIEKPQSIYDPPRPSREYVPTGLSEIVISIYGHKDKTAEEGTECK